MTSTDNIRRADLGNKSTFDGLSRVTQKALKRAAKRGTANLTAAQVKEIDRDWLMVGSAQVAVNAENLRAFKI